MKELDDSLQRAWEGRMIYDPIWMTSLMRVYGMHYAVWDAYYSTYSSSPSPVKDPQYPRNKIPLCETITDSIVKKITMAFPKPKVIDTIADESVRYAAGLMDKWLNWKYDDDDEDGNNVNSWLQLLACGNHFEEDLAYIESVIQTPKRKWNDKILTKEDAKQCTACGMMYDMNMPECPECGAQESVEIPDAEFYKSGYEQVKDENGKQLMTNLDVMGLTRRDIFWQQMFPVPSATRGLRYTPAWFVFHVEDADVIRKLTGKDNIEGTTNLSYPYNFQETINRMAPDLYGDSLFYAMGPVQRHKDAVVVWEYFRRPHILNPKDEGEYCTWIEGYEFNTTGFWRKEKFPYPKKLDGMRQYQFAQKGARFWGAGLIESLFPLNDAINERENIESYVLHRFGTKKIIGSTDAGYTEEDVIGANVYIETDEERDKDPRELQISGLDQSVTAGKAEKYNLFQNLARFPEVMQGISPGSRFAAEGIVRLQAEANEYFNAAISSYIKEKKRAYQYKLYLAQRLEKNTFMQQAGSDDFEKYDKFKQVDIVQLSIIKIDVEQAFIKSITGIREMITSLLGQGVPLIQSPRGFNRFLTLYGLEPDDWNDQNNEHIERIQREHIGMTMGTPPQVRLFDNHPMHREYHAQWLSSREAEQLGEQAIIGMQEHIQQHFMAEIQLQLMPQMIAAKMGVQPAQVQPTNGKPAPPQAQPQEAQAPVV